MAKTDSEEFNTIQFEKRLTSLKDSQDHINGCCKWCLDNRHQHKKIVSSWLNVFKRVKIEQRLILFYLANDVIQYSKRRNYDFVDTWATALQKATTLVRDDKVKHKIVRIFNIWEQRGVYNEEFISDLCGLISAVPTAAKNDEPHEFQAQYVINKIKHCAKLENDTDVKQKALKEHNPKIQVDVETLCGSLKDRAHVDDVEKELENYLKHLENYVNALKSEIKARITNISVLKQANTQLEKDKKDVKVVATAYKTFGTRIRAFQKKLDEHKDTLISPVPSPDIDAPSPSPDSDLDLPDDAIVKLPPLPNSINEVQPYTPAQTYSANYYNPVPPPSTDSSPNFVTNGFTSFIGSNFGLEGLLSPTTPSTPAGTSSHLATAANSDISSVLQSITAPPPPPDNPAITTATDNFQQYQQPLLPPPMPPFSTSEDYTASNYSKPSYAAPYASTETATTYNSSIYQTPQVSSFDSNTFENPAGIVANPYPHPVTTVPSTTEEYNPEQELETWEPDVAWAQQQQQQQQPLDTDTPESPPMFEKEGYDDSAPIEYHDNAHLGLMDPASDVDQRVLNPLSPGLVALVGASSPSYAKLLASRLNASSNGIYPFQENGRGRGVDVDHRNLISLTGSPADSNSSSLPTPTWPAQTDQDYRNKNPPTPGNIDQDYRLAPPPFNLAQLKLPPPPPPPTKPAPPPLPPSNSKKAGGSDDVQSNVVDMDLSEDEAESGGGDLVRGRATPARPRNLLLRPPPPLPELPVDPDDDANNFLDDLSNDLNSHEFTATFADMSRNVVPPPPLPENNPQGVYNKVGLKAPQPLLMGGGGFHQQHPSMMSPMLEMQQQHPHHHQQNFNMPLGGGMPFGNMNMMHQKNNMNMMQQNNMNMMQNDNMNMMQNDNMNMMQNDNMNMMQNDMGMMFDGVPQDHGMEMDEMDMDNTMYNEMNNWQNNHNNRGANRSRPPFHFRGRGRGNGGGSNFRGGRGRGGGGFRGGPNNFRGRGFNRGGGRPPRSRGNRGNFQGGF